MRDRIRLLAWAAALIVIAAASTPAGNILGTTGRTCYSPSFNGGGLASDIQVYGDWIETIDHATGPAGVTITIADKQNGAQHQSDPFKGRGMVTLRIATSNAAPGQKTITLSGGIFGNATFPISVVPLPTVTSVDAPTPADPFQDITVTLHGTGLQQAHDPASGHVITNDQLVPFVTVGGNATVTGVRILNSDQTSLRAQIFFSALIQDATVELAVRSFNSCLPLGITLDGLKTRVRVKSQNVQNFVKSFSFPNGNNFEVNSLGTIQINLLFPAPGSVTSATQAGVGVVVPPRNIQLPPELLRGLAASAQLRAGNSTVFFQFVPRDAFESVQGGIQLNPNGLTQVVAGQGEDVIPITFKVKNCLGGQPGQANTVKIQTWMHDTNRNLPPQFVEQTFSIRCIQ